MLAPINYGKPSRYYLQQEQERIDDSVIAYLMANDFNVISARVFQQQWKKVQRKYGAMYDPTTGKQTAAYLPALTETLTAVFESNPDLDAIIFTDLIEVDVQYSNASSRSAQWLGVKRKLKVQGIGNGITGEINWAQKVDGISIATYVFNRDRQRIFHSAGGIQIAQALDLNNNSGRFTRRRDLLTDEDEVNEGIALAFHPFIFMPQYPVSK